MGNVDGKEKEVRFFCPYCTHEITPETAQCPKCGYVYGPDTLDFLTSPTKKESQEYPHERRKHIRVHKTFKIAYPTAKSFADNYLSDIGTGGLFIKTNSPQNVGEEFNLKIFLPDEAKELEILCEVIWSHREDQVTPERQYPPGMGLKFLNPSKEAVERIIRTLSKQFT